MQPMRKGIGYGDKENVHHFSLKQTPLLHSPSTASKTPSCLLLRFPNREQVFRGRRSSLPLSLPTSELLANAGSVYNFK